jgi:hypothetical protein
MSDIIAKDACRVNSLVLHRSDEPDLGYYPQLFILLPLPYQDPKADKFTRKYGDYNLTFSSPYGVPSGKAARSLLSLITTQYTLQKNDIPDTERRRVIEIGNMTDVARSMGYTSVRGGQRGSGSKINKAMEQILVTTIHTTATKIIGQYKCLEGHNVSLFDYYGVCWNIAEKDEKIKNGCSSVRISPEFEQIISSHAVPVDINVYNSLNARSQDLYAWSMRRMWGIIHGPRKDVFIPYSLLLHQFFDKVDSTHKTQITNELRNSLFEVIKVYPELKVESNEKGFVFHPSKLPIARDAVGYV